MKPSIDILNFTKHILKINLYPEQAKILEELWGSDYNYGVFCLGRRSGKTLIAQISSIYGATVMDGIYRKFMRKNERFRIPAIANSEEQAKIIIEGIKQMIIDSPLKQNVETVNKMAISLDNGVDFIGIPTSARAARGAASPVLIMDELAFAMGGAEVNAGGEAIYKALSPSMAQFGKYAKFLALSSPGIQQGIFYKLYEQSISTTLSGEKEYKNMLGVKKPTWEVNPSISEDFLLAEKKRDPEMFAVEYGANWITNAQGLVDSRIIDEAVDYNRKFEPKPEYFGMYYLSLDPAKGNRDDYTANITHWENGHCIVDLWHEFEATTTVLKKTSAGEKQVSQVNIKEVENWIKRMHGIWGFNKACMDQYSSSGSIQNLQDHLDISEFIWSSPTIKKAYSKLRELFNAGLIVLPPNEKGISQLKNLTVVHKQNGQWTVTGGDKAAVDDYCAALAANILNMDNPEVETDWINSLAS